jgi:hypothetical protein
MQPRDMLTCQIESCDTDDGHGKSNENAEATFGKRLDDDICNICAGDLQAREKPNAWKEQD